MTRDMLMSHPSPDNVRIVQTVRCVTHTFGHPHFRVLNDYARSESASALALSSRNSYLTPRERHIAAPALHAALLVAKNAWQNGMNKQRCISDAQAVIKNVAEKVRSDGNDSIHVKLDYIEMNDPDSFDALSEDTTRTEWESNGVQGRAVLLSGAMWVGKTRLIDNLILGDARQLGITE